MTPPFTDEQKKRIEEEIVRCEKSGSSLSLDEIRADVSPVELKALLARLEAAERCCERLEECLKSYTGGWDSRGTKKDYKAWRRAKGERGAGDE